MLSVVHMLAISRLVFPPALSLSLSKYTLSRTHSVNGLDLMLKVPKCFNHVTYVDVRVQCIRSNCPTTKAIFYELVTVMLKV